MKLTTLETVILKDRLELPDCLHDALEESYPEDCVDEAIATLTVKVNAGEISGELSGCECEVLADCMEGATWLIGMNAGVEIGDITKAQYAEARRVFRALARKVETAIGRPVAEALI